MSIIDKDLGDSICKTCENLIFFDWYKCSKYRHCDKNLFLSSEPLNYCEEYQKREPKKYNGCCSEKCVFWCDECDIYWASTI